MTNKEAKRRVISYLKERGIKCQEYLSEGSSCVVIVLDGYENCPDQMLECSMVFFNTGMENRCYFTENAASWISERKENLSNIYRLLNFINARVWPSIHDGIGGNLYVTHYLNTPRFYITEDHHYDLTATSVINYDILEMAPLETMDYITAALPELMNRLSIPLFLVLLGKLTPEEGIVQIKKEILEES